MKCKICNGEKSALLYSVKGINICRCDICNFVHIQDSEKIQKYEYHCDYFENNKYRDRVCQNRENKRRRKLIQRYCPQGTSIMDMGCASGDFVAYISDSYNVIGYDFADSAIDSAKKKYPYLRDRFEVCSAEEMSAEGVAHYDAICMWDVIEHIDDPKNAIENLKGLVKSNGYIFISTPNIGAVFSKIMKSKWPFMTPPEHMSFFDKKSMLRLARECNLEVIESRSKGKWANLGFVFYKMNRIVPNFIPECVINSFKKGILSKINIYVPTGDIQYVVLRKL